MPLNRGVHTKNRPQGEGTAEKPNIECELPRSQSATLLTVLWKAGIDSNTITAIMRLTIQWLLANCAGCELHTIQCKALHQCYHG